MTVLKRITRFTARASLLFCLLGLLLSPMTMKSQTGASINGQALLATGKPAAFAQVRVCAITGGGIPCSPLSSLFSDPALTQPVANPYTADQSGNFSVFVTSNYYILQVTISGSGVYSYLISPSAPGSGSAGVTSINGVAGAFTFTGPGVSCTGTVCTFSGGGTTTTFSQTPSGTVNGVNVTFGLTVTPQLLILTDNGQVLTPGTAYTNSGMVVTFANPPPIGDHLYAQGITSSSLTAFSQAPSGTINGTNTVFTFTVSPSLLFFTYNGQLLTPGVGYTLSGNTVTLTTAPQIGDTLYGQGVF